MATEKEKKYNRYRRFCMTCFDMDKYPTKQSLADAICKHEVKFLIIGLEKTKKEKPHYQVYIEYKNPRTWSAINKEFHGYFLTEAKGSCATNIDYCSKTDSEPLTFGQPNVSDSNIMDKGDLASNLICYLDSLDKMPPLYEIIIDFPQFADYIIKNYKTLKDICCDIHKSHILNGFNPQQQIKR